VERWITSLFLSLSFTLYLPLYLSISFCLSLSPPTIAPADNVHTPRHQHREKDGEHTKAMVAPDNIDCPLVAGVGGWGRSPLRFAVVHDSGMLSGDVFLSGRGGETEGS